MLALNHIKGQFYQKSVQVVISQEKLHASKKELHEMIAEVEKLEQVVKDNEARCEESITRLEEEVDDAVLFYTDTPRHREMQNLHNWAEFETNAVRKEIKKTKLELNSPVSFTTWKTI